MDLARHCYTTRMRLWANLDTTNEVRWFRAEPGAKLFTGVNQFRSFRTWNRGQTNKGLGEITGATVSYSKGQNPLGYPGRNHCGPAETFARGGLWGTDPSIVTDANGDNPCCKGAVRADGGGVVGGSAVQYSPPPHHAAGGLVMGGIATQAGQYGTGGVALGGTGVQPYSAVQVAVGGLVDGGAAAQPLSFSQPGTGGVVSGGAAAQPVSVSQLGAGGVAVAGTAEQGEGAGKAYTFRAASATEVTTSGTIDTPSGVVVGDVLFLCVQVLGSPPDFPTVDGPWENNVAVLFGSSRYCWIGHRVVESGDPTTFSFSAGSGQTVLAMIFGFAAPPATLDYWNYNDGTGTSLTVGGGLATVENEVQIGLLFSDTAQSYTWSGTFAGVTSYSGTAGAVYAAQSQCAAGDPSPDFGATGASSFTGVVALYNWDPKESEEDGVNRGD